MNTETPKYTWIETARLVLKRHGMQVVDGTTGEILPEDLEAYLRLNEREAEDYEAKGVLLDVQTANALVTVWDALSEENRAKFESMPLLTAVDVARKLISK